MIWLLPVDFALSTTGFMSHGDRTGPSLMFTGLPALHTLRMKSVCRTRERGRLQHVHHRGHFPHRRVFVDIGQHRHPELALDLGQHAQALHAGAATGAGGGWPCRSSTCAMKLMPSAAVISELAGDIQLQLFGPTHAGPGDQEQGLVEADLEAAQPSCAGLLQQLAAGLALAARDEADEQRMPAAQGGQELGMRLAGQEPRMLAGCGSSTISTSRSSIDFAEITRPASSSWVSSGC